jgi:hypothetical protein
MSLPFPFISLRKEIIEKYFYALLVYIDLKLNIYWIEWHKSVPSSEELGTSKDPPPTILNIKMYGFA